MKTTLHILLALSGLGGAATTSSCARPAVAADTTSTTTAPRATTATPAMTASVQPAEPDTVAEKMLIFQRKVGGWPKAVGEKKVDYKTPLPPAVLAGTKDDKGRNDATIDNNATTREIRYLLEAYTQTKNKEYLEGAESGVRYLLEMQYKNGGFPQFYPDNSGYRHQITYNDNAMVQALEVLRKVSRREGEYANLDQKLVPQAQDAVARGIDCILKTQYVRNGKLTAWCAQYDENTLQPAKARSYELPSLSGSESVGIVRFLMGIENPSPAVRTAIESAVAWFEQVKMPNMAMKEISAPDQPKGRDRVIVPEEGSTLWARFYELGTDRPIYVGRDGVVHYQLSEIENERRVGYTYAGNWPAKLISRDYPAWKARVGASK